MASSPNIGDRSAILRQRGAAAILAVQNDGDRTSDPRKLDQVAVLALGTAGSNPRRLIGQIPDVVAAREVVTIGGGGQGCSGSY